MTLDFQGVIRDVHDPTKHALQTKATLQETIPIDSSKVNASSVLGWDGFGNLTTITKTISGVQYRRTLTYDGSSNLTDITAWVQL